jgi:CubicO group peptidase (beta-lactamase class C family)
MRARVLALLSVVALTMAGAGAGAMAITDQDSGGDAGGRFDRPRHGFAPVNTVLRAVPPEQAGLDPAPIRAAEQRLTEWTRTDPASGHPLFSGVVGLLAHDGKVVDRFSAGAAVRYSNGSGTELPPAQQVPMRDDTIFDLASISKLFTSIAVMQLVERGEVEVGAPVARYLPEFGVHGKAGITVEQLLTHTSGLEPFLPLWRDWPDEASRIAAVMDVAPVTEPGSTYTYSDLNLITLGVLVERVTGDTLDTVVTKRITEPLGMDDTGYNPPPAKLARIAATEYQSSPDRGMVRGQVHDENAWSLGGVAGHAGAFSTAGDLAVLGQTILNGGSYAGERILRPNTVRSMVTDYNEEFPGDAHGLGFELDQIWYMGALTSPHTAGHTGYTGTSLVIDPVSRSVAILLSNRVHPSRTWGSINAARQAWATSLARAMEVRPTRGQDTWFSSLGDAGSATLRTGMLSPRGPVTVSFDAFVDSESTDLLTLEVSTDGTSWQPVPMRVTGPGSPDDDVDALSETGHRQWWKVRAQLPHTEQLALQWHYRTDTRYTGRGVNVDAVKVSDRHGTLLDGEREPESFVADGWSRRT